MIEKKSFDKVTWAIGDVHGYRKPLEALVRTILKRDPKCRLILLGDLVDRGPDARGVIDLCLDLQDRKGVGVHFIRGNHEDLMLAALNGDKRARENWPLNGGAATMRSYGTKTVVDFKAALSKKHRKFFDDMIFAVDDGLHFFCHAGIRPGVPLKSQDPHDLMWIRRGFVDHNGVFPRIVVHGHTVNKSFRPEFRGNRIALDSGVYRSGNLSAVRLDPKKRRHEFLESNALLVKV